MDFLNKLQQQINQYLNSSVDTSQNIQYSEYKLKKRIYQFKSKHLPSGKIAKDGAYKFYFDIITPRVNDEMKNTRITPQEVNFYSIAPEVDSTQVVITNKQYEKYSKEQGENDRLQLVNSLYTEDGNVIVKLFKDSYEVCDPLNIFVTNTTAESINDTNVIHRKIMTSSDLRKMKGAWNSEAIDNVLKYCGNQFFQKTMQGSQTTTSTPFYEIFEYTGEMPESALLSLQGKIGGSDDKYIFARFVVAGMKYGSLDGNYVLFAEDLGEKKMEDFYRHVRRGNYKGRFWGEGMYELLFDHQIRANEIGNQIARGLDFASKTIFKATDLKTFASVKTDIQNGGIIRSSDLAQIDIRMHGLDQLIADWNRLMEDANRISNSSEIVFGGQLNSRTPFKLGNLMNDNANKYFGVLKSKLGFFYSQLIDRIFKMSYLKNLSMQGIIILTGSDEMVDVVRRKIVETWYLENLVEIGPHSPEEKEIIIGAKMEELKEKDITVINTKSFWKDSLSRIFVSTVGENSKVQDNLNNLTVLLQYEADPIRRASLLDSIYKTLGVPIPPAPNPEMKQIASQNVGSINQTNEQQANTQTEGGLTA